MSGALTAGEICADEICRAIAVFSQWSGNGLISYYLERVLNGIGITKADDQTLINGIIAIYNCESDSFGNDLHID